MSSHGSGMFSPPLGQPGRGGGGQGNTIESVLSQRRESTMSHSGGGSAGGPPLSSNIGGMSMAPGGGSGFTSPTPSQQPPSNNQFPLRSKMSAMQIRYVYYNILNLLRSKNYYIYSSGVNDRLYYSLVLNQGVESKNWSLIPCLTRACFVFFFKFL